MSDEYTMLCPMCGGLPVDSAELATAKKERDEAAMRSLSSYAAELNAITERDSLSALLTTSTALAAEQAAEIERLKRLALERYQEIEELHAAMGEANQQTATPIRRLRERAESAEGSRDRANQDYVDMLKERDTAIAQRDQAAAAERERIAAWLESNPDVGFYSVVETYNRSLASHIRANAHKEG